MLSVVMPVYNEAEIIEASVREWHEQVVSQIPGAELLVVDDASSDETPQILKRLEAELPALKALNVLKNGGHGPALRFGFERASKEYVFQTDSDRQHLPSEFWNLWNARAGYDFVFGMRLKRADGPLRAAVTAVLRFSNFLIWGLWIRDSNCPFKLMKREALIKVLQKIPKDCFIPMVLVSVLSRRFKFKVLDIPVTHLERKGGSSSLEGAWKLFRVGRLCLGQLLECRARQ